VSSLAKFQHAFAQAVLTVHTPGLFSSLSATGGIHTFDPVAIYRNHHRSSLVDALTCIYPAVFALLGEACFTSVAQDFVLAHPSRSSDMNWYGSGFSVWIEELEPLRPVPYVGDVAHFEGLRHRVFHAPRDDRLAPQAETLTATAPEDLVFALRQGVGVLNVRCAVTQLWEYALHTPDVNAVPPSATVLPDTPSTTPHEHSILVWRDSAQVRHWVLQGEDAAFLLDLAPGLALEYACERATRRDPQCQTGTCLAGAIGRDILVST
jgi:hypothetical protein